MFVSDIVDLNILIIQCVSGNEDVAAQNKYITNNTLTRVHATVIIWNTVLNMNLKVLEMNLNNSQVREQLRQFGSLSAHQQILSVEGFG